jgi:superfamily I DNA and RNA helicase
LSRKRIIEQGKFMESSYFFLQADKNERNSSFLTALERYADEAKRQIFVLDRPLGDGKYSYNYRDAFIVLAPDYKLIFVDFGRSDDEFDDYVHDFVEDLGSISDKFRYRGIIGRPREWKDRLIDSVQYEAAMDDVTGFLRARQLNDGSEKKKCELLISLLTGSINDIDKVKGNVPDNVLDKIKQKILLFDGDQTRFVYKKIDKRSVTIQGLSGTGKTELLLHKLKELYVGNPESRIMFTCHNHVLSDSLRKRIPDFFTFMKVEEQIKWDERLWCVNAWGSQSDPDSGAYRYICEYYGLSFYRFSPSMSFDRACQLAMLELEASANKNLFAFDYMLVDESQDFPQSFLDLCRRVTKNTVYVAGDIFQSIFDSQKIDSIAPDFLLSKCYRTDPRTLMFAHALGMGLFEDRKLQWLEDNEWQKCGYIIRHDAERNCILSREPLRRFEDLDSSDTSSVEIAELAGEETVESKIMEIVGRIRDENPTVLADDIGIVFLGANKDIYAVADALAFHIPRRFGWGVNKAYETKQRIKDTVFITNKNNVKGLEFPFVICVADYIGDSHQYRNALYMTMTRSFIKSYLVVSPGRNAALLPLLRSGLKVIEETGAMVVVEPSDADKLRIKTTIEGAFKNVSFYDFVHAIFDEIGILPIYRKQVFDATKMIVGETFEHDTVRDTVEFVYRKIAGVKM